MSYLGGSPAGFFNAAVEHAADIFSDGRILSRNELYRTADNDARMGVTVEWFDPPVKVVLHDQYNVHKCAEVIGAAFIEYDRQQQKKNPLRNLRPRIRKAA